jgi:hypothetical protein
MCSSKVERRSLKDKFNGVIIYENVFASPQPFSKGEGLKITSALSNPV